MIRTFRFFNQKESNKCNPVDISLEIARKTTSISIADLQHQRIKKIFLLSQKMFFGNRKYKKDLIVTLINIYISVLSFILLYLYGILLLPFQTNPTTSGSLFIFPSFWCENRFPLSVSYLDASITIWYITTLLLLRLLNSSCICYHTIVMLTSED